MSVNAGLGTGTLSCPPAGSRSPNTSPVPTRTGQTITACGISSLRREIGRCALRLLLRPRALVRAGRLNHLEVGTLDLLQFVETLDSRVGRDRQPPVAAVVGDDHAVLLQPLED